MSNGNNWCEEWLSKTKKCRDREGASIWYEVVREGLSGQMTFGQNLGLSQHHLSLPQPLTPCSHHRPLWFSCLRLTSHRPRISGFSPQVQTQQKCQTAGPCFPSNCQWGWMMQHGKEEDLIPPEWTLTSGRQETGDWRILGSWTASPFPPPSGAQFLHTACCVAKPVHRLSVMGSPMFPKEICRSPNPQELWMWLYSIWK